MANIGVMLMLNNVWLTPPRWCGTLPRLGTLLHHLRSPARSPPPNKQVDSEHTCTAAYHPSQLTHHAFHNHHKEEPRNEHNQTQSDHHPPSPAPCHCIPPKRCLLPGLARSPDGPARHRDRVGLAHRCQIGRASCRERV